MDSLLLIVAVTLALGVAAYGFVLGDRRRRRATGQAGPRAMASIGEALRKVPLRDGRVLVLFLDEDEASLELRRRLADDEALLGILRRPEVAHVLVRAGKDDLDVAGLLFQKYAEEALPGVPAGLILDFEGARLSVATGELLADPAAWMRNWLASPAS